MTDPRSRTGAMASTSSEHSTAATVRSVLLAISTLSLFMLAPLLIPLGVMLVLLALAHGQPWLGLLGLLCLGLWFRYFTHPFAGHIATGSTD